MKMMAKSMVDNPVFNDVLAFLFFKMDVAPKTTLIDAMKSFYSVEEIKVARDIFAKKSDKRFGQKNTDTILTALYDALQAAPRDSLPPFVALNLNNLPCISLNNIDGVSLVCKQTNMQAVLDNILKEQCEIKAKLASLEGPTAAANINELIHRQPETGTTASTSAPPNAGDSGGTFADVVSRRQRSIIQRRRSNNDTVNNLRNASRNGPPQTQQQRTRKPPVTGTKAGTSLRAVEAVRKVSVFVSRCHPEETEEGINNFAHEIISDDCTVQKLPTKFPTYSSFVITCDAKHEEKIMCPDEWSSGLIIRKFYGPSVKDNLTSGNARVPNPTA